MDYPDIERIEERFGIPAEEWHGRCFEIASRLVDTGLVEGMAIYGHYTGPIDSTSYWSSRHALDFVPHGWVLAPSGVIIDPTRFSFENTTPYLYVGKPGDDGYDHYDEGGNLLRETLYKAPPLFDSKREKDMNLSGPARLHALALLKRKHGKFDFGGAFWLANVPYKMLHPWNREIYAAIKEAYIGLVPIDNDQRAEREKK